MIVTMAAVPAAKNRLSASRTSTCSFAGSIPDIRPAAPMIVGLPVAHRHALSREHTDHAASSALCSKRGPPLKNNVPKLKFVVTKPP